MSKKLIPYSEMFYSMQGEGLYTGVPTVWLRFFLCNLQCNGFLQDDPTDPSTYELPYQDIDVSKIKMIEDLPVFHKGCDSSYSWSAKFKHLQTRETAEEIARKLIALNPVGEWNSRIHLAFTGGEPLLKQNQKNVVAILSEMLKIIRVPGFEYLAVTFETNGTQELTPELLEFLEEEDDIFVVFATSPKLFNVSGEKNKDAFLPEVISSYQETSFAFGRFFLKFVMNDNDAAWEELDYMIGELNKQARVRESLIYIMPVGADIEGQTQTRKSVSDRALSKGYRVSSRIHVDIYGNEIGR